MFQHTQSCHGDDPIVRVTSTYVNNVYHHVTALMGCEFDFCLKQGVLDATLNENVCH